MSRGKNLQEMEVKTQQSKTAVNSGAKPADGMDTSVAGSYEDLGGPTPENYKPDDDSAKLKEPGGSLKGVKDVVCLLYTSPSPRDKRQSRMPSSA